MINRYSEGGWERFFAEILPLVAFDYNSKSEEELKLLHRELEGARAELDKLTRRSAKADAKLEDAQNKLDQLQEKYTGGTALHIYLGEQVSDIETIKGLIKKITTNFRLPYFTITPTFSVCPSHG